jgi:hypothetical protein
VVTAAFGVVASVWPAERKITGMDEAQMRSVTELRFDECKRAVGPIVCPLALPSRPRPPRASRRRVAPLIARMQERDAEATSTVADSHAPRGLRNRLRMGRGVRRLEGYFASKARR